MIKKIGHRVTSQLKYVTIYRQGCAVQVPVQSSTVAAPKQPMPSAMVQYKLRNTAPSYNEFIRHDKRYKGPMANKI